MGDPRRGNFVPDCDFLPLARTASAARSSNNAFGTTRQGDLFDPDLLTGWNHRNWNWEFMAGVQHEIMPRVALDVGYFRRWFGNFQATDNLLLGPGDFDAFDLTIPVDPRLPDSGQTVGSLYNVIPSKFGQEQNLNTLASKYGEQTEHWNGVDVSASARLQNGVTLRGGVATGKRVEDNCEVVAALPEMLGSRPSQWCHREEPFLTQIKASGSTRSRASTSC